MSDKNSWQSVNTKGNTDSWEPLSAIPTKTKIFKRVKTAIDFAKKMTDGRFRIVTQDSYDSNHNQQVVYDSEKKDV